MDQGVEHAVVFQSGLSPGAQEHFAHDHNGTQALFGLVVGRRHMGFSQTGKEEGLFGAQQVYGSDRRYAILGVILEFFFIGAFPFGFPPAMVFGSEALPTPQVQPPGELEYRQRCFRTDSLQGAGYRMVHFLPCSSPLPTVCGRRHFSIIEPPSPYGSGRSTLVALIISPFPQTSPISLDVPSTQ